MQKKKGISLIVLVITIIVMIILAAAIILSLNNAGIIGNANQAVKKTDLANVQDMASLKWSDTYLDGKRTQEELYDAVIEGLKKEKVDTSKYLITVTTDGVDVYEFPEWVSSIVDGVPIPKGFVASSATGENTRAGGLVIYEGTAKVDDTNVENAKRSRNQYVWVPVDDMDNFKRQGFGQTSNLSNVLGYPNKRWEQDPSSDLSYNREIENPDYESCIEFDVEEGFMTEEDCRRQYPRINLITANMTTEITTKEVKEMYSSVKKYGGFYIARYEAGIQNARTSKTTLLKNRDVFSMMGKKVYNYIQWSNSKTVNVETGGTVEVARSIYQNTDRNFGVVSTLVYGVQWDTILQWWLDSKAVDTVLDSTSYGNYRNRSFTLADFNSGAQYSKNSGETYLDAISRSSGSWLLTTGALKFACVNNIYDMAGNVSEITMEGLGYGTGRSDMGGAYAGKGDSFAVAKRFYNYQNASDCDQGFRIALYIKN